MRTLAICIGLLCIGAMVPKKIVLAWDASKDAARYKLYGGTNSRAYYWSTNTTRTHAVVTLSHSNIHFFAVTAVATNGLESDYSDEVSFSGGGMVLAPIPKTNFFARIDYKNLVYDIPITNGLYRAVSSPDYVTLYNIFTLDVVTNIYAPGPPSVPGLEVYTR